MRLACDDGLVRSSVKFGRKTEDRLADLLATFDHRVCLFDVVERVTRHYRDLQRTLEHCGKHIVGPHLHCRRIREMVGQSGASEKQRTSFAQLKGVQVVE